MRSNVPRRHLCDPLVQAPVPLFRVRAGATIGAGVTRRSKIHRRADPAAARNVATMGRREGDVACLTLR